MVSIIIPSRTEKFLDATIRSVLDNATGEIEVFPVLDGYDQMPELIRDPRVKYICLPFNGHMQKRQGINAAVSIARGEFVMSLDAHCIVAKGFDEVLARDCENGMVMIPRRYKLDGLNWTVNKDWPPVDFEYWMYQAYEKRYLKPHGWARPGHENIMIDDTLAFQGSCWIMRKSYFQKRGFMRIEGYTGWGQEDVELSLETWLSGGRVVVNKNTWYAHLFKGKTWGRMYRADNDQHNRSREWTFHYWCEERKDDFFKVLKQFAPIPNWPI
jgi:cellulose synthase/poly-beta-1,6-N-acetylglucosamine synthase-like glycosyltransferase